MESQLVPASNVDIVPHAGHVFLLKSACQQVLYNKATGEMKGLPTGGAWKLTFNGAGWGFVHRPESSAAVWIKEPVD